MPALLPMFPLQMGVFPRTVLPLHIFEERYKVMVGQAIRDQSEFGIVLAKDDGIVNTGCTVTVEKVVQQYPDGRMDIQTRGCRRFEVVLLNEEKEYLRAEVEFFDDDEAGPPPPELQLQALGYYKELIELSEQAVTEPDLDDAQLSFQLAQSLGDVDFLNVLLTTRSEEGRLRDLSGYLAEHLPRLRLTSRARRLAPRNGFSGKLADT
jgi:Lon protease-like protein